MILSYLLILIKFSLLAVTLSRHGRSVTVTRKSLEAEVVYEQTHHFGPALSVTVIKLGVKLSLLTISLLTASQTGDICM